MTDTSKLRPYKKAQQPNLPGSEKIYLEEQLKQIETAIQGLVDSTKKLEARIAALETP